MSRLVTLVTGSSTGIGLACALRLGLHANKKYQVYATMRNLDKSDALKEAAGDRFNDTLRVRELDVTSDGSVTEAVQSILDEHGRIDVLVNNAGVACKNPVEHMTIPEIRMIYETNLLGSVRMFKSVLPSMKTHRSGKVIHMSSVGGFASVPLYDVYVSSKHGVEGLVEALASRMEAFNIRFHSICPAAVGTDIIKNMKKTGQMPTGSSESIMSMDPITSDHINKFEAVLRCHFTDLLQTSTEIAEVVEQTIEDEQAPFRICTSDYVRDVLARKNGDMDGSMWLDYCRLLIRQPTKDALNIVRHDVKPLSYYYDIYNIDRRKK